MAKAPKKNTPPKIEPAPPTPLIIHRCEGCGMQMKTETGSKISALCPGCETKQGATDERRENNDRVDRAPPE